jgi:uncharacterized membrane protein
MIATLKAHKRLNESLFLGISSVFCLAMLIFRISVSDTFMYIFLVWNLFLAFLPWAMSTLLQIQPSLRQNSLVQIAWIGSWLLLFPNAPYILTDLFHLKHSFSMPQWFDLVLVLSFAWVGLLYGLFSLWDIEQLFVEKIGKKLAAISTSAFLFLSAFGIYLGRFLRWNSWDILKHPLGLLRDVGDRFIHPMEHPRTWGMTLFLGLFLNLAYWSFKLIRTRQ